MFIQTQHWNLLNSVYFCFITLSTIGFGDYVPKTEDDEFTGLTEEQAELVGKNGQSSKICNFCLGEYCHRFGLHDFWSFTFLHDLPSSAGKL